MSQAMDWIKANIFIVVFSLLAIGAFVALPILSSAKSNAVQATLDKRAASYRKMSGIETKSTPVEPAADHAPHSGVINEGGIDAYRIHADFVTEDAKAVREWAIEHNRKGRAPLNAELFPDPPIHKVVVLKQEMVEALRQAYERLLADIDAGMPPTFDDIRADLLRQENQWRLRNVGGDPNSELSADDRKDLQKALGKRRLAKYNQLAETIGIYASIDDLDLPYWAPGQGAEPPMSDFFEWQWRYWMTEDLLLAVKAANDRGTSVLASPVKRLLSLTFLGESLGSAGGGGRWGGGGDSGGGGGGGGFGLVGGGGGGGEDPGGVPKKPRGPGGKDAEEASKGQPANPSKEVAPDFQFLTGRKTNPLYDVRTMRVSMVLDSALIPTVLDEISKRNFMTVIGLEMWPADSHQALRSGFLYGSKAATEVTLDIETIWLREWTGSFMPAELREALGMPLDTDESGQG